jgi:hypothetical protein
LGGGEWGENVNFWYFLFIFLETLGEKVFLKEIFCHFCKINKIKEHGTQYIEIQGLKTTFLQLIVMYLQVIYHIGRV